MSAPPVGSTAPDLDAARAAFRAGRPSLAIDLVRRIATRDDVAAEAQLLLAQALSALERDLEADAVLTALLDRPALPPAVRAHALSLHAHAVTVTTDPSFGRELAMAALRHAEPDGSVAAVALLTLARATMYQGDLPGALRLVRRGVRVAVAASPDERAMLGLQEAYLLLQQDRFEAAEASMDRTEALDPPPSTRVQALLRHARGAVRFHAGRWDGVEDLLDPRRTVARDIDLGDDTIASMAGLTCVVLIHRDRLQEARTLLGHAFPALVTGQRPFILWASLLLAEADADPSAIKSIAERLISSFERLGSPGGLRIYGIDLVRILVLQGDGERADGLTRALEARVPASGTRSVQATADALRGTVNGDAEALRRAVEGFRASGRPLDEAMTLERLAWLLEPSDPGAAILAARRALRGYERLRASRDERRLAAWLRHLGVATGRRGARSRGRVGWTSLSPSEMAVAGLVAQGLTNVDIGRRLVISPRTVESHVASALSKLGVRNRVELAATVAAHRPTAHDER